MLLTGCNLSPLLFALFLNDLGLILNSSGLGIDLENVNIASLFFADDVVIIAMSEEALGVLMNKCTLFFKHHRLEISTKKSKVFAAHSGQVTFHGDNGSDIELEAVCSYKYLGIPLNAGPRCFFKDFNENVQKKAEQYVASVMSLTRSGPDRCALAYTLWNTCAMPSILYGSAIMPLSTKTLEVLEKCNNMVGRFILQVGRSSANASSFIDAGLKPVWSIVAENVLLYARSVMTKSISYWPKLAMNYNLREGLSMPYTKHLVGWMNKGNSTVTTPDLIKKNIKRAAIRYVREEQIRTRVTSFALTMPYGTKVQRWFQPKSWVSDSGFSKILAEHRCCNAGYGNRGPAKDGCFYKLCPLCFKQGVVALNNEVHVIIECPCLEAYRSAVMLGDFIRGHRALRRRVSSVTLYSLFLSDYCPDKMQEKALCLYSMKVAWHSLMGIPL